MNLQADNISNVIADLLGLASEEFANHGCNDFELDNTPENRELVEAMERWLDPANTSDLADYAGEKILTRNDLLMSFLAEKLKSDAPIEDDFFQIKRQIRDDSH